MSTNFSKYTSSSLKQAFASDFAAVNASSNSSGVKAFRIPRPPPPAEAFINTGNPISCAAFLASSNVATLPLEPGTTGTPASIIKARAADLLPILSMTSPSGPINVIPQVFTKRANVAFSDRKPKPG